MSSHCFPSLLLLSFVALLPTLLCAQDQEPSSVNIFVAPDGNDDNPGIKNKPKATIAGALRTLRSFRDKGRISPQMEVNLWIRGGRYPLTSVTVLRREDSGSEQHPFRIAAYQDEEVILDGRIPIAQNLFQPAMGEDRDRLPKDAQDHVLVASIPDSRLAGALRNIKAQMSYGAQMLQVARFPNIGFALVDEVHQKDTPKTQGTPEGPKGAALTIKPRIPGDWSTELARSEKARATGYISASWLKSSMKIHSLTNQGSIQLLDGSEYGLPHHGHISRLYIENIIGALDEPGEWYFDNESSKLFLWPPHESDPDDVIGVWAGPGAFEIKGADHILIERLIIENLGEPIKGGGAISIRSGNHNTIAGCTFRNIASPLSAINITGGTHNGVRSSDFFDIENAGRLNGGSYSANEIVHGKNYIENCHFTKLYSKSFYGKVCGISGAGNIFRNNMAHNHNGQIVTLNGVDHLIERNEIFNTGIEEGDGGAFYQGAMFYSWGNTFRHNFFHHILCLPKMYSRAAIFSDDGDLGDDVIGNVFYKAGEGFKSNVGAGHYARDNITIGGIHAFQFLHSKPKERYNQCMEYLSKNPTEEAKNNLMGRALGVFGKRDWENSISPDNWIENISPFWFERYPRMRPLFEKWARTKRMDCINELENNFFFEMNRNPLAVPDVTVLKKNSSGKSMRSFVDPKALNFSFRTPKPRWAPDIPFENIGLYQDTHRTVIPNKDDYRREIAAHWEKERSAAPREYDVKKVNERSYLNTGLIVLKHLPKSEAPLSAR